MRKATGQPNKRRYNKAEIPNVAVARKATIKASIARLEAILTVLPDPERKKTEDRIRVMRRLLESTRFYR